MAATYEPIATFTSSGSTGQFSFTSIPQTYTDLVLVFYARSTFSISLHQSYIQVNGSASGYSSTRLVGDGASASSSRATAQTGMYPGALPGGSSTAGVFGAQTVHFLNYSNTSKFKTILARTGADLSGSGTTELAASLWSNTAAISSILLQNVDGVAFASGSTATLYGIKAA